MLRYVDGRNTDDIDLVLSAESLARVPEIAIADTNANFAAGTFRSLRVDVRFASNPFFRRVMDSRMVMHPFAEMEVPCATVEGLVKLKLYALPALYEQRRLQHAALYEADITMLAQAHGVKLGPVLERLQGDVGAGQFEELRKICFGD